MDKAVNLPRGFAYVEFSKRSEAEEAQRLMDGGQLDGNQLRQVGLALEQGFACGQQQLQTACSHGYKFAHPRSICKRTSALCICTLLESIVSNSICGVVELTFVVWRACDSRLYNVLALWLRAPGRVPANSAC